MHTILICDDQPDIVNALKIYLAPEGYRLLTAFNGREAMEILHRETVHLVLLDIMMPQMDGITAMSRIREFSNIPIILLTAKSEQEDIVLGLNLGADDYITKPFVPVEVLARVRSQLRRFIVLGSHAGTPGVLTIGSIQLDDSRKQVTVDGDEVYLTPIEYSLLRFLMQNPNRVFSSQELYRAIWQEDPLGSENVVSVHIRHLREKIEITPSAPRYIKVVWGRGYKLEGGQ